MRTIAAGVEAVVATRDALGRRRTGSRRARGGRPGPHLESTEELVCDVLDTVAERDPDTGEEVDAWSLASEESTD